MTQTPKKTETTRTKATKPANPARNKSAAKKTAASTSKDKKEEAVEDVKNTAASEAAEKGVAEKASAVKEGDRQTSGSSALNATAETSPSPSPPPSMRKAGPWLGVFIVLILLCALGAGAFVTRDIWWAYVEEYLPQAEVKEDPRVAILMERLGTLETLVEEAGADRDLTGASFQELQDAREKLSAELASVMERLEAVEKSLETVEQMAVAVGSEADGVEAQESLQYLVNRVDTLEQSRQEVLEQTANIDEVLTRLSSLEEQNRTVDDTLSDKTALLEDVKRRMDSLEASQGNAAGAVSPGASALILAVGQLREAVRVGRPFSAELESLKTVLPEHLSGSSDVGGHVGTLETYAETGVASQAGLRDSFPVISLAALQADQRIEEDGWFAEIANRLSNLVTIRRVGDASAGTVDARLASAESHLAVGDLNAVIEALSDLTGPGADAIAPWLEQVQATYAAEQALRELNSLAIAQLSASREKSE